jgi:hypothetical protein
MSTGARTEQVIATSRAFRRTEPVTYLWFVPAHRLRNATVVISLIAFLLAPFWTPYSPLLAPGMALTGVVVWHLLRVNKRVPWLPGVMALMACIQWIVAPWLNYALQDSITISRMPLPSDTYFAYFVPAAIVYVLGLYLPLMGKVTRPFPAEGAVTTPRALRIVADVMLFGGVLVRVAIRPYAPGSVGYVVALLGHLMYVGAFSRVAMGASGWQWRVALVLLIEFGGNAIDAQFVDALIWMLLAGSLVLYRKRVNSTLATALGAFGCVVLFAINGFKGGFRDSLRYEGIEESERPGVVASGVTSFALSPSRLFSGPNVAMNISRLNEGWIAGRVLIWVPYREPYAQGETIRTAVVATVVPRLLDADKAVAGGRDNVPRFTGLTLNNGTSMNISIPGEMYANYGFMGGLLGSFVLALLLGSVFRMFVTWSRTSPLAYAWAPYLLFGAVSPEMGIFEVIGTLGKASVVAALVIFGTQAWRSQLPLSMRKLLSFSGSRPGR